MEDQENGTTVEESEHTAPHQSLPPDAASLLPSSPKRSLISISGDGIPQSNPVAEQLPVLSTTDETASGSGALVEVVVVVDLSDDPSFNSCSSSNTKQPRESTHDDDENPLGQRRTNSGSLSSSSTPTRESLSKDQGNNDNEDDSNNNRKGDPDSAIATDEDADDNVEGDDGFGVVWKTGRQRQQQEQQQEEEQGNKEGTFQENANSESLKEQQQQQPLEEATEVTVQVNQLSDDNRTVQEVADVVAVDDELTAAAPPLAPIMDAETTLVSNHNKAMRKTIEDALTITLSRHPLKLPNVDAVSTSVTTSVNRALDRFKLFATSYVARVTDIGIPDILNTSTESSHRTDDDDDDDHNDDDDDDQRSTVSSTPSEFSDGLDIQELEAELRSHTSNKSTASEKQEQEDAVRDKPPQRPNRENIGSLYSVTSCDSVGRPKPAVLVRDLPAAAARKHIQKPVPVFNVRHHPKRSSAKASSPIACGLLNCNDLVVDSIRARAVTPIVRMRHPDTRQAATTTKDATTRVKRSTRKSRSDKEYMALQQKQWQQKLKMMRRISKQRAKRRSSQRRRGGAPGRTTVDTLPLCQYELARVVERFVRRHCGNVDDVMYEDDEDEEEWESDDDESDDYETATDSDGDFSLEHETRRPTYHAAPGTTRSVETSRSTGMSGRKPNLLKQQNQSWSSKSNVKSPSKSKNNVEAGVNDKVFIKSFIFQVTKKGMVLMLHKQNRGKSFSGQPLKVHSSIKLGSRCSQRRECCGPKYVWESIDSSNDVRGEIDLFDIATLDKATVHQLGDYPLAMPGRSIFIRSNNGAEFLFEALSDKDALRFMHGMRWVIARLAFNLLIGNVAVSCELLDVERSGDPESEAGRFPQTLKQEANWTKAMDDVTCDLVDKTSLR